jgi:hypothetical protein
VSDKNSAFPLMISVVVLDAAQLSAVYALLGGVSAAALTTAPTPTPVNTDGAQETVRPTPSAPVETQSAPVEPAAQTSSTPDAPSSDDGELDAAGWPWSADMHASTRGKTKEGLWRMKVGVSRPDPKPGFPVDSGAQSADTGTPATTEPSTPSATSQTAPEPASAPAATSTEDDDEFAAFRAAAAASDATDAAAAASVPARTYSDADLGALCNQAAVKLGDPNPVKEIIAKYVPEGQVSHSRNIPEARRGEFVAEVEAKAGIEFAG